MFQVSKISPKAAACSAAFNQPCTAARSAAGERTERDQNWLWATRIRRIAEGDIDALAVFYDETSTIVFRLILNILQNRQLAEETLVEIYHRVWQEARNFDAGKQTAFVWLITSSRNLAVDRLRRSTHPPEAAHRCVSTPIQKTVAFDTFRQESHMVSFAVAQLTEEQRSILQMTYFRGLNVDEVADQLGLSPEYVRRQIVIGMKQLRLALERGACRR